MQKVQWRARKAFEKEGERIILVIDEKGWMKLLTSDEGQQTDCVVALSVG
jgi:hypothetical protein